MTTHICINILHGAAAVEDDDRLRAEAAAYKVLEAFEWRAGQPLQIDPGEAHRAHQRHVNDEEYYRSAWDMILIAAWEAAETAANLALTEGWHNPNGAACAISTWELN